MAANDNISSEMMRSVFNALPSLVFVVDDDVRIQEYNAAAEFLLVQTAASELYVMSKLVQACIYGSDSRCVK